MSCRTLIRGGVLGAATLAFLLSATLRDSGQALGQVGAVSGNGLMGGDGTFFLQSQSGMAYPRIPPQGDWAEVIMANGKWMVMQTAQGRQFPVSFDTVRQFLVRWPISPAQIPRDALLEVTGVDLGSNRIRSEHIDVYEGSSRSMVTPAVQTLIGYNRVLTPYDVELRETYGVVFPLLPEEYSMPQRLHVVGPPLGLDPVVIAIPGNNAVSVLPAANGLGMTQVTPGSASFAKKGDIVYFVPESFGNKSLALSQMILYKRMPYGQFAP